VRVSRSITQAQIVLSLLPFSVLPAQARVPTNVSVFVADAKTASPLVDARVEFSGLRLTRQTDSLGVAYFPPLKSDSLQISVSKIGYKPVHHTVALELSDFVEISIAMKKLDTQLLDTVNVLGSRTPTFLRDFERRRAMGLGKFFTSAQLDSSPLEPVVDQVARRIAGVRAVWQNSRMNVVLVSQRGPIRFSGGACRVSVYVDGEGPDKLDLTRIQSSDVAGVEYYSVAPPVQYSRGAACGVVLIWTKR
jgi:outer membrane receptor protein involved in Fe transport